jgi:[ribosomal protein S18]-alanine N-acetyltransferase
MSYYDDLPYRVSGMQLADIDEVMVIEARAFSSPWSARAYRYEISSNSFSHFVVVRQVVPGAPEPAESAPNFIDRLLGTPPLRRPPLPPVLGYAGFWLLIDEAHISTIAVAPEWRGLGLGELLLVALLDRAIAVSAETATLEVRAGNHVAQNLYRKHTFQEVGLRKGYYSDNREDALIMTTPLLQSWEFRETFEKNKGELARLLKQGARRPLADRAVSQMG